MRGATIARCAAATAVLAVVAGCGGGDGGDKQADPPATGPAVITVTSAAFDEGQPIPDMYSCDGAEVSPPLAWSGVPSAAAALALVVDDPDAPGGAFVHWLVANIDPGASAVDEGATPASGVEVANSSGDVSYAGPCPPSGTHHYRFTVYALSEAIDVTPDSSLYDVFSAIDDASVGHGTLTGTYTHR
ncbi:MAG TPA: YbhB/YbcL family Raf kinase inhibitor-like protein [Nocardioidaceae bacterium]|nr:YbhB/YbcL family Raf kinase inhibitor-like protein [Nocardioidaceae bacterium]